MTSGISQRLPLVDLLRGLAVGLMVAYHFCYDLDYFGLADFDFYREPFWLYARGLIVGLFLLLVGVSLVLATAEEVRWPAFGRSLGILMLCALLISGVSYIQFTQRWIFFGVLHFIAVASVLGLLFIRRYWFNLITGAGLLGLGLLYQHAAFDQPALQWLGLMTFKPATEDYVPLLPWFGVVLIGMFMGQSVPRHASLRGWLSRPVQHPLGRWLVVSGRHSLGVYLLHQPVLMGVLWLAVTLFSPGVSPPA